MYRAIPIMVATLVLGVLVGGCGSTSGGPTTTSTATAGSTRTVATSPPQTTTVARTALIVFEGGIPPGGAGNRVVDPNGTGDTTWLTPSVPLRPGGWQVHPDWSPDGTRIAFAADNDKGATPDLNTRDLWVANADGSGARRVLDCHLPCLEADNPAWSPDGTSLLFEAFDARGAVNVNARLAILDPETGTQRTVYTVPRRNGDIIRVARWSPDGRRIVFEVDHATNGGPTGKLTGAEIDVIDVSGAGKPRRLSRPDVFAVYPDWSWKTDTIVFSTRPWSDLDYGPSNLYTIAPDGSHLRQITHFKLGETRAVQPSFTPDGTWILFTAVEGTGFGSPTMAKIRPDGSDMQSATSSGPMFGTHPRLQPLHAG
jgi:Tol biopolymer transport system component